MVQFEGLTTEKQEVKLQDFLEYRNRTGWRALVRAQNEKFARTFGKEEREQARKYVIDILGLTSDPWAHGYVSRINGPYIDHYDHYIKEDGQIFKVSVQYNMQEVREGMGRRMPVRK